MKLNKANVLDAIYKLDGNVSAIARQLGVTRRAVYYKIAQHDELQEALDDARETLIDDAETELRRQIKDGNIAAIIFTLKTQGKARGYVERVEQTGKDGDAITVKVTHDGHSYR